MSRCMVFFRILLILNAIFVIYNYCRHGAVVLIENVTLEMISLKSAEKR